MITEFPGFKNLAHDSQSTFRILLNALSRPGTIHQITAQLTPPSGLNQACAAACLTLLDLETQLWLQPGLDEEIKNWLQFHTGCRFTEDANQADFAVIWNLENMPYLSQFKQGTPVYPEDSTTFLITVETINSVRAFRETPLLKGAGINGQITMQINLPESFETQWQQNYKAYPQGIDVYFFDQDSVVGLPRTSKIT